MPGFHYKDDILNVDSIPVHAIAEQFGTPCYIYSQDKIVQNWTSFNSALSYSDHMVCYAVKANPNIAILNLLANLGSGFDIVSIGELERVLAAGGDPQKIVFSGVGKRQDEIERALAVNIFCFNVESSSELKRINNAAKQLHVVAPISLRVNPNVDAKTHPHITTGLIGNKFGVDINSAKDFYAEAESLTNVKISGIDCHIGSQLTDLEPYNNAFRQISNLADDLRTSGFNIEHINLGGGLGIKYKKDEILPTQEQYINSIKQEINQKDCKILVEPGRSIMGDAGILLTRIEYLKHGSHKNFAVVDAAMTELLRPALYNSWHEILPINKQSSSKTFCYDVVGPVCESADFLGKDRQLAIQEGDLIAIFSTGAYGASMASSYNSRPEIAAILVQKDKPYLVQKRGTVEQLMQGESILPSK
jgi:diaminopimelate decarboxylase